MAKILPQFELKLTFRSKPGSQCQAVSEAIEEDLSIRAFEKRDVAISGTTFKEDSGIFRRLKGGETDSRGLTSKGSCVLLKLQSWQNQYDAIPDTDNTQANIYVFIMLSFNYFTEL